MDGKTAPSSSSFRVPDNFTWTRVPVVCDCDTSFWAGGVACDCRYLGWIAHEIRDDTTDIHGRTFYEAVCVDGDNFHSFDHSSKVCRGHVIDYNVKAPSNSPSNSPRKQYFPYNWNGESSDDELLEQPIPRTISRQLRRLWPGKLEGVARVWVKAKLTVYMLLD
jgi:hypothetical protein